MKNEQFEKRNKAENIMMGDQSTSRFDQYYEDHITSIVRRAEKEGQFEGVKGKTIQFDSDMAYNPEKALNKVLKDNGVLPRWMELKKEIESLRKDLEIFNDEANIKKTIDLINKKVMDHNLSCPRTSHLGGINLQSYLNKRGIK
ncbi:DUF1992 domain-containing protein [Bacillus salacetis]|uniref:DUF1992 domain-containing protein n=1 Tax=Bacillus salacetis TaxID=2315464 RepID=A0A3A1R963_9BACI|nr:DUF1992 domain-containing protein [Bacillus salacetis]RIW38442.1 DUF1992 domain-containing protein [Bacillus salacetis]